MTTSFLNFVQLLELNINLTKLHNENKNEKQSKITIHTKLNLQQMNAAPSWISLPTNS